MANHRCAPLSAILLSLACHAQAVSDWEEESFVGNTRYTISSLNGSETIKGEADKTASVLYKRQRIDLLKSPLLQWRWKIDKTYDHGFRENTREGDDFPARVYVVVKTVGYPGKPSPSTMCGLPIAARAVAGPAPTQINPIW